MRELALLCQQLVEPLLKRPADDDAVDVDRPILPDAVNAVGGLVFDGRVPPAISMDDMVRRGKVHAVTCGQWAAQRHAGISSVERVD